MEFGVAASRQWLHNKSHINLEMNSSSSVVPGDYVASARDFTVGYGLYSKNGDLRSCIMGIAQAEEKNDKVAVARPTIHIHTPKVAARDYVVRVEDVVLCKVTRVNYNQAYVDIFVRQPGKKSTKHNFFMNFRTIAVRFIRKNLVYYALYCLYR